MANNLTPLIKQMKKETKEVIEISLNEKIQKVATFMGVAISKEVSKKDRHFLKCRLDKLNVKELSKVSEFCGLRVPKELAKKLQTPRL